ncbi:lysophospholipase [Cytobacillus horneckiae]|uniref:Alpha/beta hydrolase n=1 Tax=Cytobacillus horneckiae TaxID=549687 RepID=A0A2N0ZNC8_9BACI|nr:alpha/beta hydrolase [Cytobacillus horneckiae]NRG47146.1 alpha/beta hydrolase [Bacillus sp. CRN 9]MBN6889348.1 alpha/beta hydrolase [Cytobacillus horneckiae]MCM3179479.1 alpha/beta hydrolase [Cytobacillus horneckiae]MEC1154905.1 alpha/beta hydrolase [Cytobacillus horneckiae]MED2936189.1 alpha/beta hydrolase [Cytobacillus horneckiae]
MWKWEAEGEAKAVIVMVHGAMEHHGRYGWLIEMWRLSGFHVIMGDLPGQGMTTRSRRGHIDSFDEYLVEVKDWIQAAYDFELPVFLLGHSMGGLISIRLLQEERLKLAGVILSSPCLGLVTEPAKPLNILSFVLNHIAPSLRISSGLTIDMATRNADVREVDSNDTLYITKVSIRWYRELAKAMKQAFEQIEKVQDVPLLVMQGGDDKVVNKVPVRTWFNKAPFSEKRFKEWPKCYHEIFNDPEREDVFDYAKDFVISQLKAIGYLV